MEWTWILFGLNRYSPVEYDKDYLVTNRGPNLFDQRGWLSTRWCRWWAMCDHFQAALFVATTSAISRCSQAIPAMNLFDLLIIRFVLLGIRVKVSESVCWRYFFPTNICRRTCFTSKWDLATGQRFDQPQQGQRTYLQIRRFIQFRQFGRCYNQFRFGICIRRHFSFNSDLRQIQRSEVVALWFVCHVFEWCSVVTGNKR